MARILVIYDSRTGNTEEMARAVTEGAREAGAEVEVKRASEARPEDLLGIDGLILGSPTHFGSMSDAMKGFIDKSVRVRGKLEGKVGAAFTSSLYFDGGNETTLLSLLQAMLMHGMIVVGDPIAVGGHYGVVAVGKPDERALRACRALGRRVAELARKLSGG